MRFFEMKEMVEREIDSMLSTADNDRSLDREIEKNERVIQLAKAFADFTDKLTAFGKEEQQSKSSRLKAFLSEETRIRSVQEKAARERQIAFDRLEAAISGKNDASEMDRQTDFLRKFGIEDTRRSARSSAPSTPTLTEGNTQDSMGAFTAYKIVCDCGRSDCEDNSTILVPEGIEMTEDEIGLVVNAVNQLKRRDKTANNGSAITAVADSAGSPTPIDPGTNVEVSTDTTPVTSMYGQTDVKRPASPSKEEYAQTYMKFWDQAPTSRETDVKNIVSMRPTAVEVSDDGNSDSGFSVISGAEDDDVDSASAMSINFNGLDNGTDHGDGQTATVPIGLLRRMMKGENLSLDEQTRLHEMTQSSTTD